MEQPGALHTTFGGGRLSTGLYICEVSAPPLRYIISPWLVRQSLLCRPAWLLAYDPLPSTSLVLGSQPFVIIVSSLFTEFSVRFSPKIVAFQVKITKYFYKPIFKSYIEKVIVYYSKLKAESVMVCFSKNFVGKFLKKCDVHKYMSHIWSYFIPSWIRTASNYRFSSSVASPNVQTLNMVSMKSTSPMF